MAVLHRRLSLVKMLIHWVVTFFGNLAGSLFIVAIITGYGGLFDTKAFHTEAITFATAKQVTPGWHQIFLRAIGANWLVCLACFLGMSGREYFSKIVGIWWPTFAFVTLGFDHVVANMVRETTSGSKCSVADRANSSSYQWVSGKAPRASRWASTFGKESSPH